MIYLSIILVLLGILILVYSLFFNSDPYIRDQYEREEPEYDDRNKYYFQRVQPAETYEEDYPSIPHDQVAVVEEEPEDPEPVVENNYDLYDRNPILSNDVKYEIQDKELINTENTAVLFEDSSNVIDYSGRSSVIDPSFNGYKNIRRVGLGRLIFENDGMNFYKDKKFFRFDFYKINDIKIGSNYLALITRGSETVKLFVFLKKSNFIDEINHRFRDYIESRI